VLRMAASTQDCSPAINTITQGDDLPEVTDLSSVDPVLLTNIDSHFMD